MPSTPLNIAVCNVASALAVGGTIVGSSDATVSLRVTEPLPDPLLPWLLIGLIDDTPVGLPVTPLIRSGISTLAIGVPSPVTAS